MLTLSNVTVQYGGRVVLDNITFSIGDRDRIGLVGRNGAGKSTTLKIIAGHLNSHSGGVSRGAGTTIGFLHQEMLIPFGKTVLEETMTAFEELLALEVKIAQLNDEMTHRTDYESDAYMKLIEDFSEANDRYQHLGGEGAKAEVEKILMGLGFKTTDFNRLTDEFSGGWKMRVELAKMLLRKPDYLLLDEPTNHLDIESILWLEEWLKIYEGAVVVISHDKTFLDNVTNRTVEIELGKASDYRANYSKYLELREERRELMENAFKNQQQQIAQTERLIDKFRAKANKAKFAQSLIKQLDRMDRIEMDETDDTVMRLRFPPAPRSGEVVCEAKRLTKRYGDKLILDNIDFHLDRGGRVAFVGKNGEGKTTLSKILIGIEPGEGHVKLGHNVMLGYYAQNHTDSMHPNLTVYDTIERISPEEMRPRLRAILGSFLFSGEDIDKKVVVLSGGEKARLALACLLLKPINLLVLDEPTNHLDMKSKDVLKEALLRYDGAMIVVSHDRDFLTGLTDRVVEFDNRKTFNHLGDITGFLEKRKFNDMREVSLGKDSPKEKPVVSKAQPLEDKDKNQRQVSQVEKKIGQLEKEMASLNSILGDNSKFGSKTYSDALDKHAVIQKSLDEAMAEWESLM